MSFESSLFSSLGACTFKTPVTSQNYICHPITNKHFSLNCLYFSVVYKKSCSQLTIFASLSVEKNIILCSVPPSSHLTSCKPTTSNSYPDNYLATVVREPDLHTLLTFHAKNLMFLFRYLERTKQSVQARDTCIRFATRPFFVMRSS